jgi:hypothetical protein
MPIVPDTSDPDMVVKRFIEPMTGEVHALYYYKRKLMPQVPLQGLLSEQLAGYVLIEKDLQNALRWVRHAEYLVEPNLVKTNNSYVSSDDRETYDLTKGLFVAALTFYAKCFTKCEGRRAQLNKSSLDAHLRASHDLFMTFRNNFAAHSGAAKIEYAKASLVLHPKSKKQEVPRIVCNRLQPDFLLSRGSQPGLADLIIGALSYVNERHEKLTEKILQEEILPKGSAHWYKKAKRGA